MLFLNIFVAIAEGVFLYKSKQVSPLFFITVVIVNTYQTSAESQYLA